MYCFIFVFSRPWVFAGLLDTSSKCNVLLVRTEQFFTSNSMICHSLSVPTLATKRKKPNVLEFFMKCKEVNFYSLWNVGAKVISPN